MSRRINNLEFELRCFENFPVFQNAVRYESLVLVLTIGSWSSQELGTGLFCETGRGRRMIGVRMRNEDPFDRPGRQIAD